MPLYMIIEITLFFSKTKVFLKYGHGEILSQKLSSLVKATTLLQAGWLILLTLCRSVYDHNEIVISLSYYFFGNYASGNINNTHLWSNLPCFNFNVLSYAQGSRCIKFR